MRISIFVFLVSSALAQTPCEEGARLEEQRRWKEASAVYESALREAKSPEERFWLLTSLAEMAYQVGDYRQTRRWLTDAGKLADSGAQGVRLANARGALHLVEGKLSAAHADLSTAVSLAEALADPDILAAALHNLAGVEMQCGELDAALRDERRAISLWQQQPGARPEYLRRAWVGLSSIQGLQKHWRDAEQSLLQALALGRTPEVLNNYAVVLERLHRRREAQKVRAGLSALPPPMNSVVDVRALGQDTGTSVVAR